MTDGIKVLHMDKADYPEAIAVLNALAALERRSAHDAAKLLMIDEGTKKIEKLKQQKEGEK